MQFSLKYLLAMVTLAAVLIAGVVYASRLDGLALLILVVNLLIWVVLPASIIGTIVGIWRVNNRLAIVSGATLGECSA